METEWKGALTRAQAIRIFDQATDGNDAFWDELMDEYYDEGADSWPTIFQLFDALGVGREEYEKAIAPPSKMKKKKRCPNHCYNGSIYTDLGHGDFEQEECQWCYE